MGIIAVIIKEILLLLRDKIGLLILFILPLFLLIIVSLSQQNMDDPTKSISVLLINEDSGETGTKIASQLVKKASFKITEFDINKKNTQAEAEQEVATGQYNALIVIDKNLSSDIRRNMIQLGTKGKKAKLELNSIHFYTDPALPQNVVDSLKTAIDYLLQTVQLEATQNIILRSSQATGDSVKKWFVVKQQSAQTNVKKNSSTTPSHPNSVQQNAPAWTLFGMFFIVIPLAGQMVRERSLGVIQRIRVAPVPQVVHLIGRVICYFFLNLVQMSLMLLVSAFLLPVFGLPALNLQSNLGLVYLIGGCASLAAIGFGLLIGMYATSYQQATIFAPFIIVIAAAISGIFIPIYLMPEFLKSIGNFFPLYWAQSSFIDIFVRDAGFNEIWMNVLKLLAFFVVMLVLALLPFTKLLMQRRVNN